MLHKLSSRQEHPSKKCLFGHVTSLMKMSSQHIQKYLPGLLHTPAKYEKNLPYGCKAIAKRNLTLSHIQISITHRTLNNSFTVAIISTSKINNKAKKGISNMMTPFDI